MDYRNILYTHTHTNSQFQANKKDNRCTCSLYFQVLLGNWILTRDHETPIRRLKVSGVLNRNGLYALNNETISPTSLTTLKQQQPPPKKQQQQQPNNNNNNKTAKKQQQEQQQQKTNKQTTTTTTTTKTSWSSCYVCIVIDCIARF